MSHSNPKLEDYPFSAIHCTLLFVLFTMCEEVKNSRLVVSVGMFQLEKRWTNFDEIWYGHHAADGYHRLLVLISYSQ
jgi:hypothetical protein